MKLLLLPVLAVAVLANPAIAQAQPIEQHTNLTSLLSIKSLEPNKFPFIAPLPETPKPQPAPTPVPEPVKLEPVVYTVVEGDNLSKIGTEHNVEWQRLWAKNTQLQQPDRLDVGEKITIPLADEKLSRDLPAIVTLPPITPGVAPTQRPQAPPALSFGGGNTYDAGYCTWYVKNRRGASLPNTLGNANTWYSRAAALGMAVGTEPRAGAVGTTTAGEFGHVVYVESVNADRTINISEMNYKGWGITSYRTTSASEFLYIY